MMALSSTNMKRKIISHSEAKALGLPRYFTGKPCKNGHVAERRIDGNCIVCFRAYMRKFHAERRAEFPDKNIYRTPEFVAKERNRRKAWREKFPEKWKAHMIVEAAIKSGKLISKPCEKCGIDKYVHAHHDDYSKPLSVRWLCVKHHREHHSKLEE